MITAGPTREPLDPVRYISNHSSGKMGFAIAAAAAVVARTSRWYQVRFHYRRHRLLNVLM